MFNIGCLAVDTWIGQLKGKEGKVKIELLKCHFIHKKPLFLFHEQNVTLVYKSKDDRLFSSQNFWNVLWYLSEHDCMKKVKSTKLQQHNPRIDIGRWIHGVY